MRSSSSKRPSSQPKKGSLEESYIYVTVGTTRFDALVAAASSQAFLTAAESLGFQRVLIQYGRGPQPLELTSASSGGCRLSSYSLKSDISSDMRAAGFVVSHGGAGSVFEALRARKGLLVACNPALADNHQEELARAMGEGGHCRVASQPLTPASLALDLKGAVRGGKFTPLPPPNPAAFLELVNTLTRSHGSGSAIRGWVAIFLLAAVVSSLAVLLLGLGSW